MKYSSNKQISKQLHFYFLSQFNNANSFVFKYILPLSYPMYCAYFINSSSSLNLSSSSGNVPNKNSMPPSFR